MSQENIDVVRRFYERLGRDLASRPRRDRDITELFDPEIHVDQTRRVLNPGTYDGYDGVLRGMAEIREAWERFSVHPERFIDAGDHVVVVETVHGRGRGGGVEVVHHAGSVYTLKQGGIVRLVVYWDPSEALEAMGLESRS